MPLQDLNYPVTTRYEWINFVPTESKDINWAKEQIKFIRANSLPLAPYARITKARSYSEGTYDTSHIRRRLDPPKIGQPNNVDRVNNVNGLNNNTVLGDHRPINEIAKYIRSDFNSLRILKHIKTQTVERVFTQKNKTNVQGTDNYFVDAKTKERYKILVQQVLREHINKTNKELGLPPLDKKMSIDEYLDGAKEAAKTQKEPILSKNKNNIEKITKITEALKMDIMDSEEMAIYMEDIHKDPIEIGMELGIDYLQEKNSFDDTCKAMIKDAFDANAMCCQKYISQTTGLTNIKYLDPSDVSVGVRSRTGNLKDIPYWRVETFVTFGEFLERFGAQCTPKQLEDIFNMNRIYNQGAGYYSDYESNPLGRNYMRVNIGYAEWRTQNKEVYVGGTYNGQPIYEPRPSNYEYKEEITDKKGNKKKNPLKVDSVDARHYNVWYKAYYVSLYDSKYVFDFGKVNLQNREGDDMQFANPSLVAWYQEGKSITESCYDDIDLISMLYYKYQNEIARAKPSGTEYRYESFLKLAQLSKTGGANESDNIWDYIQMVNQTGDSINTTLTDKNGTMYPDAAATKPVQNNSLQQALQYTQEMEKVYAFMQRKIGFNDISEGANPNPRQGLGTNELLNESTTVSLSDLINGFKITLRDLNSGLIKDIQTILSDKNNLGYEALTTAIGVQNTLPIEALDVLPTLKFGIFVEEAPTKEQENLTNSMVIEMSKTGQITPEDGLFIVNQIHSYKYKMAILTLKRKQAERKAAEIAAQQSQLEEQKEQQRFQEKAQLLQIEYQGKNQVANTTGQWSYKVEELRVSGKAQTELAIGDQKHQHQVEQKNQVKDNKIEEMKEQANLEAQKPIE